MVFFSEGLELSPGDYRQVHNVNMRERKRESKRRKERQTAGDKKEKQSFRLGGL